MIPPCRTNAVDRGANLDAARVESGLSIIKQDATLSVPFLTAIDENERELAQIRAATRGPVRICGLGFEALGAIAGRPSWNS